MNIYEKLIALQFSSPDGVWVVSGHPVTMALHAPYFRPLTGCELFPEEMFEQAKEFNFRPLTGCELFRKTA